MSDLAAALRALDHAGIGYRFRKGSHPDMDLTDGGEVDLEVDEGSRGIDRALAATGFHRLRARGHEAHLFYLSCSEGTWTKIDVRVEGRRNRRWMRVLPPSARRAGAVIAFLGPDGAGKSTVIEQLRRRLPIATSVVYLGDRKHPSRNRGPTTAPAVAKEVPWLLLRWVRHLRVLWRAYWLAWLGEIVLCDRHPIEVKVVRPRRTAFGTRLEAFLIGRLLPLPDRIVILDAQPEVLASRKREHPIGRLRAWRDGYTRDLAYLRPDVVSSEGDATTTVDAVSEIVWAALAARRRW